MKTLLLEIDESIYAQVIGFLQTLPEQKCHIIETSQQVDQKEKTLDICSAFGIVKTPITSSLAELRQGIVAGAIDDCH
jgi:hypothetical protein